MRKKTAFDTVMLILFCGVIIDAMIKFILLGDYFYAFFVYFIVGVMVWMLGLIHYHTRVSPFMIFLWMPALWINKVFSWLVRKKDGA